MPDEVTQPYRINPTDRHCEVRDELDRVVLVCGDAAGAQNYVVLLNEAYCRGHQAGFRQAKKS